MSSLSKVILDLGKGRSHRAPNLCCRGLSHLGDLMFCQKPCIRRDAWVDALLWWSCQSPVAHSCGLLNHLNSFVEEWSSVPQNLMLNHCSIFSVILNAMATQYTCSVKGIYSLKCLTYRHLQYSEVVIVHIFTSQSTFLGCQLHWCCTNHSHYINNGWTFSGQTLVRVYII